MKLFAEMFRQVDATTKTTAKVAALRRYFEQAEDEDKVWAIAIMSHRRPKRPMTTNLLREWASEACGIPLWLFEESYHIAGDLAETISLLTHNRKETEEDTLRLSEYIRLIIELRGKEDSEQKEIVQRTWSSLNLSSCFVFNKLLTGGFRMGISRKLMTRALAQATEIEEAVVAHKIMGNWDPETISFQSLILDTTEADLGSRPYPFYLAYSVEEDKSELGAPEEWQVEWKWDGIRGQIIVRNKQLYVWTRGEELVTDRYPEFEPFIEALPDGTVLDGEILAFKDGLPMDFRALQKRLGRKIVSTKIQTDIPVVFMAYDVLEHQSKDYREVPQSSRRTVLEQLAKESTSPALMLSPMVSFGRWTDLDLLIEESRERRCEGFMLKRKNSVYEIGRKKGNWWKWKVEPFTIDAVLTFAMRGHGRRANLYTDYTFGLWQDGELVTFAKAYSGLTDAEFKKVDHFIRKNTLKRFGPVREVTPQLVFELAFEGIAASSRHKSGVAVRFPRMVRWRTDKKAKEANSLDDLKGLVIDLQ